MPRPAVLHITSLRAWGIVLAPVRIEIIEVMRIIAPCSIAEVSAALDRPADSLYRHMNKLVSAGVAVRVGVRQKGRHSEQVYDLAADDISPGWGELSVRQANKLCHQTMGMMAKALDRSARDSARHGELVGPDKTRHLTGFLEHAWLTPEDLIELRARIMAVKSFLVSRKTPGRGRLYVVLAAAVPVTRKRGARLKGEIASEPASKVKKKRSDSRAAVRSDAAPSAPRKKRSAR